MRKLLLLVVALGVLGTANAQIRWGAKAGGNLSHLAVKDIHDVKPKSSKVLFGFHAGGVMEYTFYESLSLQPELLFLMNGGKTEVSGTAGSVHHNKYWMSQLQLPINLKYKFGAEGLKMYAMAGPYVGFIMSGTQKSYNIDAKGVRTDNPKLNLYKKSDMHDKTFKRVDLGIGATIGVEVSNFTVGVGYQLGLMNIAHKDTGKFRTSNATLSVGYFF